MADYLILKLDGVMQSWGDHTYEDFRPTVGFPTRSGLVGLLAACLGIDRSANDELTALNRYLEFSVRAEARRRADAVGVVHSAPVVRITDFHTVMDARKVDGSSRAFPVVSKRQYLCDAVFTVALRPRHGSTWSLDQIEAAVKRPVYTPSLGRRACALSRPLFEGRVEAADGLAALAQVGWKEAIGDVVYADADAESIGPMLRLRDDPIFGRRRQFANRSVLVLGAGGDYVSE